MEGRKDTYLSDGDIVRIVETYSDMLLRIAMNRVKSVPAAEDIVQTVFERLMRRRPIFESREHEKAWLIRTAVNLCLSDLRAESRHGRARSEFQNGLVVPTLVQAEKRTRTERIAGTDRALDPAFGKLQARHGMIAVLLIQTKAAFRAVDGRPGGNAHILHCLEGNGEIFIDELLIFLAQSYAGGLAGFKFIDDAVIGIFKRRRNKSLEAVAGFAYDVNRGLDATLLGIAASV